MSRIVKRLVIWAYCRRLLTFSEVDRIFERFPPLRGA